MTISSTNRSAGPYTGNGITTSFPFGFKVFAPEEVVVVSTSGDTDTPLIYGAQYTVLLNPDQDANPGGTVTLSGPPGSTETITITSDVQNLQPIDFTNQGGFYPKVLNNALDRLTILVQQVSEAATGTPGAGNAQPPAVSGAQLISVKTYGAKGDGVTDDTSAFQVAINSIKTAGGKIIVPAGIYMISAPIVLYGNVEIVGDGEASTAIVKTTNTVGLLGNIAAPSRAVNDNYNVDAIIVLARNASQYAYYPKISGLTLKKQNYAAGSIGIFAPRMTHGNFKNLLLQNVQVGIQTFDAWLCRLERVTCQAVATGFQWANDGTGVGSGTSCHFDNCWINFDNTVAQPVRGFDLFGLTYSTLTNPAIDNCIRTDNGVPFGYYFGTCRALSVNSLGMENSRGTVLYVESSSSVFVGGLRTIGMSANSAWGTVGTVWVDGSRLTLANHEFAATSPGTGILNWVIQNGGKVIEINPVASPSGGNSFISYSGGGSRTLVDNGDVTFINATGTSSTVKSGNTGNARIEKYSKAILSAGSSIFTVTSPGVNSATHVTLKLYGWDSSYPNGSIVQEVNFAFHFDGGSNYYQSNSVVNTTSAGNNLATPPAYTIGRSGNVWTITCTPGHGDITADLVAEFHTLGGTGTFAFS